MTRLLAVMRRDEGSILPLTIFFGLLCLVMVLGAVAATSLYLDRKRLFTIADGAALVGAEAFDLDDVRMTTAGFRPHLTSADVEAAVLRYLATVPAVSAQGVTLTHAGSFDGRSATVTLGTVWRPPVLQALLPAGVPIRVTAVARSVFG